MKRSSREKVYRKLRVFHLRIEPRHEDAVADRGNLTLRRIHGLNAQPHTDRLHRTEQFGKGLRRFREFVLENAHSKPANHIADEIEERGEEHDEPREGDAEEDTDRPRGCEYFVALEFEGFPTELGEPALNVSEGAGRVRDPPEEHPGGETDDVRRQREDNAHLEGTPRVDVSHDSGDLANALTT